MTPELLALTLAGLLQCAQFVIVSIPANRELGPRITTAPRDDGPLEAKVSTPVARLARAMDNHATALSLFAVAVVVVTLSESASGFTALCAWLYVIARVVYVPAYYYGWAPWRSLLFFIGWSASLLMLLAALL